MTARIAVFGTESTGKTTLAGDLAQSFAVPWVPEYVRTFWEQRRGDIRATDLGAVARGQIENEDAAAARAGTLLICDTELITNTLWADLLFPGCCPAWVRDAAERRSRRYTLYLLCDTDIAFVDDEQRCFPEPADRARCRALWREALIRRNLPFVDITGPPSLRLASASAAIVRATGQQPRM